MKEFKIALLQRLATIKTSLASIAFMKPFVIQLFFVRVVGRQIVFFLTGQTGFEILESSLGLEFSGLRYYLAIEFIFKLFPPFMRRSCKDKGCAVITSDLLSYLSICLKWLTFNSPEIRVTIS